MTKKVVLEKKLEDSGTKKKKDFFYIVGIGSSAGGLKALEEFFDNCPDDTGFAFVIVQHLSPDYKSLMPELLSRHTKMSVKEAKEDDEVLPNHAYLIPGNKNITIKDGFLQLPERPPSSQMNFSIDLFFTSLAKEQKEKTIGIILSGTGSDGTKGARLIKEAGGTVLVQSPESSKFDGMPRSAITQGLADYILEPRDMGNELLEFVSQAPLDYVIPFSKESNNSESLSRVLKIIKNHVGYDFFSYKKPTLLRRTAKRIHITKSKTVENYIDYLYDNPEEKFILTQEYLIGVTKFFRDTAAFDIMEKKVIPEIVKNAKESNKAIKIWSVGCSSGEEAYSIAILIEEYLRKHNLKIEYKIFATDIDDRGVDAGAKGLFSENISTDVSQERLSTFFTKKENQYQIHPSIRRKIIFSKHDILQNPPFNKMDLVTCRNLLIYMENNIQLQALSSMHYALNQGGFLFLGSSEHLGVLSKNFEEVNTKWKIYKNIQPEGVINLARNEMWRVEKAGLRASKSGKSLRSIEDIMSRSINQVLLEEFKAVSVVVDENFEILQAVGKLKKYLHFPEEGFSNNLLKVLPDELNIPITTAIRKRLVIQALQIGSMNHSTFLITFYEDSKQKIAEDQAELYESSFISSSTEVTELKEVLNETRENLQATIEELETSNEEMQATNEELLASNEELQSTNEELQSLNEELHTVNAELQEKNSQLLVLNADVENLMKNINIGTIFLDKEFKIRKFTPSINEHFKLRNEDIGRQISHFSGTLGGENIVECAEEVIKSLIPYKKEVKNKEGNWFLMQIFPYRNEDDMIRGVVINFVDIDDLKKSVEEKEKLNTFLTHLTNSTPAIIYIHNTQTQENFYVSENIWALAGYSAKDIKKSGNNLIDKLIHPEDITGFYEQQKKYNTLKDNEELQYEYRILHKSNKEPIWILATEKVNERDSKGKVKTMLGVAQVTTTAKQMEHRLKINEERFRLAIKGANAGLWEWSNLDIDEGWWSEEFYNLLDISPNKLKPSFSNLVDLIHPDQIKKFRTGLEQHIETGQFFEEELKMKTPNDGYKWFRINAQAQVNEYNTAKKIVGTLIYIDDKVKFKKVIEEKQAWLNAIYQNVPVGILLIDKKKRVKEASEGFSKIINVDTAAAETISLDEIISEEDIERFDSQFNDLIAKKAVAVHLDVKCNNASQETVWCNIKIAPLIVEGKPSTNFYCCTLIDINERKESENKMRELNMELERFAYLASHDLKEPLRTVTSFTKLFKKDYEKIIDENGHKYLDFIENASGRMITLTNDLLIYSQLDDKSLNFQPINLNLLISEILEDLQKQISENGAKITVEKLPITICDALQIRQLFQNLIANSLKYRKKTTKPKIFISCENKKTHLEFSVKDNGIGIETEYHQKIFEVFKRLHSQSSEYQGTGIGLANCKRIVDNHQGKIWVKSSLNRGSTFYFTIPKTK